MIKKILFSLISSLVTVGTLLAAPQAIVFDFGGVLTGEQHREVVVQFIQKTFDLTQEKFDQLNQEKRKAWKEGVSDEEFWLSYAKTHGIELPSDWIQAFKSVMKEAINVNPRMFVLVEELREQRIPVALLSNVDDRLAKLIRELGLYEPFHPCVLSCEIGVAKPDLRAYEILLNQLKLPAQEVIFIDDRLENVEAAKQVGIDAILFQSEEQLRFELNQRL